MLAILTLGFLIGITHAFEADHLAAVSSLVSGKTDRNTIMKHGALWGVGHTTTLLLVGGVVLLTGNAITEQFSMGLELIVGVMLVGLGGHVLYRLRRDRVHFHRHQHKDGTSHFHIHSHRDETAAHDATRHQHSHPDHAAKRTLAVGMMHGAAGSAALVLIAAAAMTTPLIGLLYILLFGAGSILGMVGMSVVIALPLTWTARAMTRVNGALQLAIGTVTIGLGIYTIAVSTQALLG
jgi:cytochrome c biogenesis protein CcdA